MYEDSHKAYDMKCEKIRENNICYSLGFPCVFIRFNPDDYIINNDKITSCWSINKNGLLTIKKSKIIDNANISSGDVIVGLESFGKANYESEYNGGMGSNGLTSARHDIFNKSLALKYPESFDPLVPDELIYSGSYGLKQKIEGVDLDARNKIMFSHRVSYIYINTFWHTQI